MSAVDFVSSIAEREQRTLADFFGVTCFVSLSLGKQSYMERVYVEVLQTKITGVFEIPVFSQRLIDFRSKREVCLYLCVKSGGGIRPHPRLISRL